ncbi:MAG TPA: flavodoxin-dependent (E)-4-hydroxy-3-methylbut-2-enyl-diphosphate synthase [Terriglobales bacterium]|nr:flavodoxin-dependent (E)-4-hydroxy-3-methylbut-2-enyl-diphosphate synthase [Terriglobales bacterium]
MRRISRTVYVKGLALGGGNPVLVQSMTNTPTEDAKATAAQANRLAAMGCKIVRVAVPDMEAAKALTEIRVRTDVPLVADIHFDYRLALAATEAGIDKIRINPGNIGSADRVRAVADACRERAVPIRIGVNSGSVEKDLLAAYGGPTPMALADSALRHADLLDKCGFEDIVISVKASTVTDMVEANRILAVRTSYPLHLGVTEAGLPETGAVRSAVGIGALLLEGIGDTLRVSLTAPPEQEIAPAYAILAACGLHEGPRVVSCPTCGRTRVDLIPLARRVEEAVARLPFPLTVAVMGCAVNGPGEAREADVGVACGEGEGLIFRAGKILRKVPEPMLFDELMLEIKGIMDEKTSQ